MKLDKKIVFHALIILIFSSYLLSANYIFNVIIKTNVEARIIKTEIPTETQNINFSFDESKEVRLKWKKTLCIKGWTFKDNVQNNEREIFIVLKAKNAIQIIAIKKDKIPRPDVTDHFDIDKNIRGFGFEAYIPFYLLNENFYQLGIIIKDETGTYYTDTKKAIILSKNFNTIIDYEPQIASNLVNIDVNVSEEKISYYFDDVSKEGYFWNIRGWGFINGFDTNDQKSFILLKKDKTILIFDTRIQVRKDITIGFKKYLQNLDKSGFKCQIPAQQLEIGSYQIGLYIVKNGRTGIEYSDKYINVGK